jgi:hypothetical protein
MDRFFGFNGSYTKREGKHHAEQLRSFKWSTFARKKSLENS